MDEITTIDDLLAHYGTPSEGALAKEQSVIHPHYRSLIEAAPFCAFATVGPGGTDCTPRGDGPGFVKVIDERTLEMADRKGNNRLDSLRNIVEDGRVSLLFLIPRRNETMRINGRAVVTADPEALARHADTPQGHRPPATVIRITVDTTYYQCGKAMIRSGLWEPDQWPDIDDLPTAGTMSATFRDGVDAEAYDRNLDRALRADLHRPVES